MDEILKKLSDIDHRLRTVEDRLGMAAEAIPPASVYQPAIAPDILSMSDQTVHAIPANMPKGTIESTIGRWWLGIAGVIAILFGVSFFLKYAFENNLIGPTGRVMLGLFAGLGLIGGGEWLRAKFSQYAKYSYILTGGGLGLLYLSIYGAFWYYALIDQGTAFAFMAAVTAFGVVLSLHADALELAALAFTAGFLTPFLLSNGAANDFGFFESLILLNAGILWIAFFKKWHTLTLLGFVGTVLSFSSWYAAYYTPAKLFFTIALLTIFYLFYILISTVGNMLIRKMSDTGDLFIITLAPAWYFGWLYYLLNTAGYKNSLGFVAVLLGALYVFLAYGALKLHREDSKFTLFLGGVAVVFLTIAIPLQLDGNAITIAWAIEALVLYALGLQIRERNVRYGGVIVYVISLIRLFGLESGQGNLIGFMSVFNARFLTYLAVIAVAAVIWYLAREQKQSLSAEEHGTGFFFATAAFFLVWLIMTLEIGTYFDAQTHLFQKKSPTNYQRCQTYTRYSNQEYQRCISSGSTNSTFGNQKNTTLSVFWLLYAAGLITIGIKYRKKYIRWAALGLFGITILKVFFIDLAQLETLYRILSFIGLGIVLLAASFLYFKFEKKLESVEIAS